MPAGVRVYNCYGHAEGKAEFVMLSILLWCRVNFLPGARGFRKKGEWRYSGRVNGLINARALRQDRLRSRAWRHRPRGRRAGQGLRHARSRCNCTKQIDAFL